MVEVISRATYSGDLVIAVTGPAGTFCNDDFEGLNPGIRRWLTAGEYQVYVGPLSSYGVGSEFSTSFSMVAGSAPIDLGARTTGLYGITSIGSGTGATTLSGRSGGMNSADTMDASCRGYITEEPSFIVDVTDATTVSLSIMSEGDTTLVVSGPEGVFCNDDFVGLNPGLEQYLSAGRYGVWVGSYSAGLEHDFMATFRSYYY